ncbi:amyloid beta A4 protein [Mytilus galloprovincialis]|uniref:Amyloid beta A4 protein n=2 Tax=Mytilus galloprovincialis TaxID=29158 RepID=A0A8B6FT12_MYTGA|nr:amyloid beta A4 protein [Mytilus galloprovincialis]
MRTVNGQSVFILFVVLTKVSLAYIEALAANIDNDIPASKFVPSVAFKCGRPAMHKTSTGWQKDINTDCKEDKLDILKYCQSVFKNFSITNIVEDHEVTINWPDKFGKTEEIAVTPYRCIVGRFESDALLVPRHCKFEHEHGLPVVCEGYQYWADVADKKCKAQNMKRNDFAMLLDCDIGKFNGVEYVCCPDEQAEKPLDVPVELTPVKTKPQEILLGGDDNKEDAYIAYLRADDSFLSKYENEHDKFLAAESAMDSHHHERITKMMKEWQEARSNVNKLKESNPKGAEKLNKDIMQRFQRLYSGYEQADQAEKKQLVALHMQHRQAELNKRKRINLEKYMAELQKQPPKVHKVKKFLEAYIRVEEKDRMHTLNHFTHVRRSDPAEAKHMQKDTSEHLKVIDERIKQSLDMLHHYKKIEKEILPDIKDFLSHYKSLSESALHVIMRPFTQEELRKSKTDDGFDNSESWDNEKIQIPLNNKQEVIIDKQLEESQDDNQEDMENEHQGFAAQHLSDQQNVKHQGFVNNPVHHIVNSTGSVFGIAIGSVAVFVIIVVAVIMLRRNKSHRHPVTHGFVEVDPAASPEERHVANMQMNGYENPTYKYFELSGVKKC